jgi:hypothetical protein
LHSKELNEKVRNADKISGTGQALEILASDAFTGLDGMEKHKVRLKRQAMSSVKQMQDIAPLLAAQIVKLGKENQLLDEEAGRPSLRSRS